MSFKYNYYWERHPGAPFSTLLRIVSTYCHPEAYEEAYDDLISLAHSDPQADEMRVFKEELREALTEPGRLPENALFTAASYDDGTDEAFLRRIWRDLYGDEPILRANP